MKRIFLLTCILVSVFLLSSSNVFADTTIIQGNASSDTSVTTQIQGSGSVHTHIESTVNGQTKTLDNNQPGTYTLHNSSSGNATSTAKPTSAPQKPTPTKKPTKKNSLIFHDSIISLESYFHSFLQKVLEAFHL